MLEIYRITGDDPTLTYFGSWTDGILAVEDKKIQITEDKVKELYNRGYWRCRKV